MNRFSVALEGKTNSIHVHMKENGENFRVDGTPLAKRVRKEEGVGRFRSGYITDLIGSGSLEEADGVRERFWVGAQDMVSRR